MYYLKYENRPSYLDFYKTAHAFTPDTDYRKRPEKYRVGKGEEWVFTYDLYKGEIG